MAARVGGGRADGPRPIGRLMHSDEWLATGQSRRRSEHNRRETSRQSAGDRLTPRRAAPPAHAVRPPALGALMRISAAIDDDSMMNDAERCIYWQTTLITHSSRAILSLL